MTRRPLLVALVALAATGCAPHLPGTATPAPPSSAAPTEAPATAAPPSLVFEMSTTTAGEGDIGTKTFPGHVTLAQLAIDDRPYVGPAYDEKAWRGSGWADIDGDGCDAREQALRDASLDPPVVGKGCEILAGRWAFVYVDDETTNPGALDIDHVVALGLAQVSGGADWLPALRRQFANDPANLVPVQSSANRSKGDRPPAEWQPKTAAGRCVMATRFVAVAGKYHLTVTTASRDALGTMLEEC